MFKLKLLPPNPERVALYYKWRQDATAQRFNPLGQLSLDAIQNRLAKASAMLTDFEAQAVTEYFFFAQWGDEIVGHFALKEVNYKMQTAEFAYGIAAEHRDRGLATPLLKTATQKVFAETPLRKLIGYVHVDNLASRRAVERAGYRQEGLLREHCIIQGKPADQALYGLLREEFRR